jgi:acetyl-CoA carboxylase carboxyltransferase component
MNDLGKALTEQQIKNAAENVRQIKEVEKTVAEAVDKVKKAGLTAEEINKRGEMTVYQRLEYLLDPGTWCPLHTLYDPMDEESGTTGVVDGLGKISGRWAVIIGFVAGAGEFLGYVIEYRNCHATRPAPFRPEVNDKVFVLPDSLGKLGLINRNHGHLPAANFGRRRIQFQFHLPVPSSLHRLT